MPSKIKARQHGRLVVKTGNSTASSSCCSTKPSTSHSTNCNLMHCAELGEYNRQQAWLAHRERVQNATSVVNSQPPVRTLERNPCKEMTFAEMVNNVRTAVQQKGNVTSFSNLPVLRRSTPSNCTCLNYNVGNSACANGSACCISGSASLNSIGMNLASCRSVGCVGSSRCCDRWSKYCPVSSGPGSEYEELSSYCSLTGCESRPRLRKLPSRCSIATNSGLPNRFDYWPMQMPLTHLLNLRRSVIGGSDFEGSSTRKFHVPDPPKPRCSHIEQKNKNSSLSRSQSETRSVVSRVTQTGSKGSAETQLNSLGIPSHVMRRYQSLVATDDDMLLRRLLRPRVFFDLELKGVRPLGRLCIQLYTEACPEVVLEFVRTCISQNQCRLSITRLFPPLWMEGELALTDNKTLAAPSIEHDTSVLDHGASSGILSFPSRYLRGSKRRFLSFSISFKPVDVLNGKRIAFGRVRRGLWVLYAIEEFTTKNGKPQPEITVKRCGMLQ